MLKSKICFTVFVLYEIIATTLLHYQNTCNAMFSGGFCSDGGFKYFLICAAVPMMALVLGMWIHEVFFARRRRSFFHRARDIIDDVAVGIKKHMGRAFDMHDMDKYLVAAILFGIKKYSARHPQMRDTIRDIIASGNTGAYLYDDADDIDDYFVSRPDTAPKAPRRRASVTQTKKPRAANTMGRRTAR